MNDNIIMSGIAHHFTDLEIADIISLFGDDPVISILEDGTQKDRRRAKRRKATAHHHQRLEDIFDIYNCTVKDGRLPNLKKRVRAAKSWSIYDDLRKDPAKQELAEARKIAEYIELRDKFLRLVDGYLTKEELDEELLRHYF